MNEVSPVKEISSDFGSNLPKMTMAQAAEALNRHRAGESKSALAREYGLSRMALSRWLAKVAGDNPVRTPEQERLASVRYVEQHVAQARASASQGRTPPKMTMAQAREALDRSRAGETTTDLARDYGLSRTQLRAWFAKVSNGEGDVVKDDTDDATSLDRQVESDPGILRVVHAGDSKALAMIAIMFDSGATEPEKESARQRLRARRKKVWHRTPITSAGTQSTPPGTKSQLALASSQGG